MAAVECVVDHKVLSKFAQKLASNEKRIRDVTLKKLKKWISARIKDSGGFNELDFLKLWKGLHYCMWMADKPLVQEELADNMSNLIHCIEPVSNKLLFIDAFFQTEAREWFAIDRLRLDKFMMLIRRFLRQCLVMLKNQNWKLSLLSSFNEILMKNVVSSAADEVPDGLKYHFADIYVDEIANAGAEELSVSQVQRMLDPYCLLIAETNNKLLFNYVMKKIFDRIIEWASLGDGDEKNTSDDDNTSDHSDEFDVADEDEKNSDQQTASPRLKVDCEMLADALFELASEDQCFTRNRAAIYNLITKLRQLEAGILPEEQDEDEATEIVNDPMVVDSEEFDSAVARLQAMYEQDLEEAEMHRIEKKKRKRINSAEDNEEAPVLKKQKSREVLKKEKKSHLSDELKKQKKLKSTDEVKKKNIKSSHSQKPANDLGDTADESKVQNKKKVSNKKNNKNNSLSAPKIAKSQRSLQSVFTGGFEDDDSYAEKVSPNSKNNHHSLNSNKQLKKLKKKKCEISSEGNKSAAWDIKPVKIVKDKIDDIRLSDVSSNVEEKISKKKQDLVLRNDAIGKNVNVDNSVSSKPNVKHVNLTVAPNSMKHNSPKTHNGQSLVQFVNGDQSPSSAIFFKKAVNKTPSPQSGPFKLSESKKSPKVSTPLTDLSNSNSKKRVSFVMSRNQARDYIESVQKLSSSPLLQPAVSAKPILKSPLQQSTPTSRMGAADFF